MVPSSASARFFKNFYLFLAALGLGCCTWVFSSCGVPASLCVGFSCCRAQALGRMNCSSCNSWAPEQGSVVVVHGLSCPVACGILPARGRSRLPLHYKADFQHCTHQGSPRPEFYLETERRAADERERRPAVLGHRT